MSNYGYEVPPMSWNEIDDITENIRRKVRLLSEPYFPILKIMEEYMADREGLFDYEIIPVSEMPEELATTSMNGKVLSIREDIYYGACSGDGRSRFTLAHEFGHMVLHCNRAEVFALNSGQYAPAYKDSEKQADYFAASLLMPKKFFSFKDTHQSVMRRHGVSAAAARIRISYFSSKGYLKL